MVFIVVFFWIIAWVTSAIIANGKGYSWVLGMILGIFLGALGIIIVAILPGKKSKKGSGNFKISAGSIAYGIRVILRGIGF